MSQRPRMRNARRANAKQAETAVRGDRPRGGLARPRASIESENKRGSSNGDGFIFHHRPGFSAEKEASLTLDHFPTPMQLWSKYCKWKGTTPRPSPPSPPARRWSPLNWQTSSTERHQIRSTVLRVDSQMARLQLVRWERFFFRALSVSVRDWVLHSLADRSTTRVFFDLSVIALDKVVTKAYPLSMIVH